MKSLIALVIAVVVGLVVSLMMRLGAFKDVEIKTETRATTKVIYKHHVGAYHTIVPVIEEVETWAKANGEACAISFGEYIDNPDAVAEDRLRSNGGCVVNAKPSKEMPDGFKFREIPAHQFLVAQFDGAPSIGPMKVYPRAKEAIEASGAIQSGPTFELYEVRGDNQVHTTYLFPVIPKGTTDSAPIAE